MNLSHPPANTLAVILLLALFAPAAAKAAPEGTAEKVRGFDLDKLAMATAQATAFSTQYGSDRGQETFDHWLRQQGLSLADYEAAYDNFLVRFEKDPSGRLEESYFAALDRYTPGEQRAEPGDAAIAGLAREDEGGRIDSAFRADAWKAVDQALPGETDAASQLAMIDQLLADSQARASSGFLAMQDVAAEKYSAQFESLRKGRLPGTLPGSPSAPSSPSPSAQADGGELPAPPPPPGSAAALHLTLQSPDPATRRGAARAFAWECDGLALVPAADRERDERAKLCASTVLRTLWLPVAREIFDAAPAEELHRVASLLDYLRPFQLENEARAGLEGLRERLRQSELETTGALAEDRPEIEKILLKKRSGELREALAAVERALGL